MTNDSVRRRHVFFLSGFDPKGASYYHRLFAEQAALQAKVTGVRYSVGARTRLATGNTQWQVQSDAPGGITETTYEFVRWDDIVRSRWPRTGWSVFSASVHAYASAIGSGWSLVKVWRVAPKTLFSLAYPGLFWLAVLAVGVGFGLVVSGFVGALSGSAHPFLLAFSGIASALCLWFAALRWERKLHTSWLLRIYQFAADWAAGRIPELPARLRGLSDAIHAQLRRPEVDEVLLVGFSVGSMLAASTAARMNEAMPPQDVDRFSMLTLGHCIPLLGLMPQASAFRADLARLGDEPALRWADFSSPTDWGSFALVDPVALCLPGRSAPRHGPMLASPRFYTLFEPATYAQIRRDKRRMHLQYLMAGEVRGTYDYFALTAGPSRLATSVLSNASA